MKLNVTIAEITGKALQMTCVRNLSTCTPDPDGKDARKTTQLQRPAIGIKSNPLSFLSWILVMAATTKQLFFSLLLFSLGYYTLEKTGVQNGKGKPRRPQKRGQKLHHSIDAR